MRIIQLGKIITENEELEAKERIIIIDDNEDICNTLSLILEDEGYKTEIALTGQQAIKKIINKSYNVALLDINLPDVKGTEIITSIKEIHPNMDIIMITANTSSKFVIDALNNGASGYILKPFDNDNLLLKIKNKLERQRLITEKWQAEQGLHDERDNLINILNSMQDGVCIVNQRHEIEFCNPVLMKEFGSVEGRKCYEYFHDRQEVCPWCKNQVVFKGKTVRWEWYSPMNQKTYDLLDTPLKNSDGTISKLEIFRDITEQKNLLLKLKESEEKFRALFENTNDTTFIHDKGSQFIEINQTACERLGYAREELLKLTPKDLIPPGYKVDIEANIKTLYEKGELIVESEHLTKDGIIISVEINSRIFNFRGKETIISVARDITERKVIEQELKESEEKWRALSENSPAHIMLCDREHKILFINRTVPDLSKEEVIGTPAYNYIPQKERQLAIDYRDSVWETGEPITYTTKYKTKKGDTRYFDVWHSPVFQNGKITALVSQHMDITEHKKAEEALEKSEQKYKHLSNELEKKVIERTKELKESEQKFRKMISELDVGYFNIGMDGKLIFHNSAFNKIGGYNVSENFIGKIGKDFWVNPIEFKHYMEQILKNGSIENFIARVKKKNGEGIFIELNSHLVRDMNGNPTNIEGTFIDVTQKFEYEKKLREQNLRLKEINEFKTNLMNRTSHELQTPLISILGFTDIILHKYKGKLDPDLIEYLEIINKKSYYLTRTIRSLIDTAYLEKDILQINVYKEDLALLFRDCVKHLDRIIKFRNQSVILNVNNILITNFDKGTIHRVFESLLENAINNTPSGGKIEVRSIIEEDFYIISVKDNGIGLLKKEVRQLFKPFGKIERYGKGVDVVIDGTGLSLYISKRIIELHGGKIWVKSKGRNLGSTFFFSLPIVND